MQRELATEVERRAPLIHWSVWAERNPEVFVGGLDGWKYDKGLFRIEAADEATVIKTLVEKLAEWFPLPDRSKQP